MLALWDGSSALGDDAEEDGPPGPVEEAATPEEFPSATPAATDSSRTFPGR